MNRLEHLGEGADCRRSMGSLGRIIGWAKLVLVSLVLTGQAHGAVTLVHDFYLPMPEAQIRQSFQALNAGTVGSTFDSVYSVVVTSAGTVIYYDHWEDGYETDLRTPAQSTTQIWGDGNDANGIAPGYAHDPASLPQGAVLALRNNVTLPRNPATILYDARDRIAATKALVISRAAWATSPGPVLAGAVEVTATIDYGTSYVSPIGEDLGVRRFDYVGFFIMAEQDGTVVTVDTDGSGPTASFNVTLNRGESYLVNGGVKKGGSITSTKPIEVQLATGRKGASYAADWFTLYPSNQWSSTYVTPVGTANNGNATIVYLYNPNGSSINVNYTTRTGSGTLSVAAGGVTSYQMPRNSGAKFISAGGEHFFALSSAGASPSNDIAYDWGFTLLPLTAMTPEAVVGWGPGSSDGSVNGSPVWVTALADTRIYVDYNGDGAGALTDPKGGHYDAHYDVVALESKTIYDPDKDQTAMRLYTLNGAVISTAWGQDPAVAGAGNPYLDFGTTVLPFPVPVIRKSATIIVDNLPAGLSVNDILEYTIEVDNRGLLPLGNVVTIDTPPPALTYQTGSTTLGGVSIPDSVTGTLFPLDGDGYTIPLILRDGTSIFKYQVQINSPGVINNTASTSGTAITAESTVTAAAPAGLAQAMVDFTDSVGGGITGYYAGDDIYVTLSDADANTDPGTIQTIEVIVRNDTNGDYETITLTETGPNTGIFRNLTGLPTSLTEGVDPEDGTLNISPGHSLSIIYIDPVFFDTDSATISIQTPSETKMLYLSGSSDLDRIDPVASGDVTTSQSAALGSITLDAVSTTTVVDPFTSASVNHTTGTGGNRLMMVGISYEDDNTAGLSVTSVTYGGTPLTLVVATNAAAEAATRIYYLLNPPSGTATLTVNVSGASTGDTLMVGVATFFGVNQTTPLGAAVMARGASTSASLNVPTTAGDVVFDSLGLDDGRTTTVGSGQTELWNVRTETGADGIRGAASTELATGTSVTMSFDSFSASDDWGYCAVPIKPASKTVTFTQTPNFVSTFSMPIGGALSVSVPASVLSGSMPANPSVTAYLKYGSTVFATLSSPTYGLVSGVNTLVWNGTLGANHTIPSGSAVSLIVSNAQSGVSYRLEYDSTTRPAKISLPTTTVIKVQSLGLYDAPYPGGNLITAAANGSTVYLRAAVTDPFGTYDITSLDYNIDGPGAADISGTLSDVDAVSNDGTTKIYEYAWATGVTIGSYGISVTANEGSEGISDSAATSFALDFLDLGTPSSSAFTSSNNGPVATTFTANATVWLKVTDPDENTDPLSIDTLTVTVTSSSGDSETVILSETGVNTGIFTASLATSSTVAGVNNDSSLYAPLGSVMTLTAIDPDDSSDVSTATAIIPNTSASASVTHTLVTPADGSAVVGDSVQFQIYVVNNGNTTLNTVSLTDAFPAANLSFVSASSAPDSTGSGTLTWNNIGPLASGASRTITVDFTALASANPANLTATVGGDVAANDGASVIIRNPSLSITHSVLTPGSGDIGSSVVFRITVQNTGDTIIQTLPLEHQFSGAYFEYNSILSATPPPDGIGSGSLFWSDIGPIGVGSSVTIDVTLTVIGGLPVSAGGADAISTVYADYGIDQYGDPVSVTGGTATTSRTTYAAKFTGHVTNDLDGDGVADPGEPGLAGVYIELYTDPNMDGDPSDGVLVAVVTTDSSGDYEILNLPTGDYVLVETDPDGFVSVSPLNNRLSVNAASLNEFSGNSFFDTIDTTAPAAPSVPDMTAGTDLGGSSTDNITSNATPTFTGTAEPGSTVKLYTDFPTPGTLIGTGVADEFGNYSITVSTLADGTHNITATATDFVGNVSTASGALTVVIDTTPPAAVIASISGDTGSSNSDFITMDTTLLFTGTTSAGAEVTLTLTDSLSATVFSVTLTADASGNWSYDYTGTPLPEGSYTLEATSGTTATQPLVIDTTQPAGPVTANPQTTDDTTPVITGTATVGPGETLTVTVDGVTYTAGDGNLVLVGNNWTLTIPPGNALDPSTGNAGFNGEYIVTAAVTDTAGNVLTSTSLLTVTVFPTITAATGGGAIPADNFGTTTYVTLTGPIYAEGVSGDVGAGTIVLNAPSGFAFDTGASVTVLVTGGGTATDNINDLTSGSTIAATVSATQITITVSAESLVPNTLTWQNIRVVPTAGAPLATGDITVHSSSTSVLTSVTPGTTSLGTLTEVAGAVSGYQITGASPTVGAGGTDGLTISRVDQYGNVVTTFSGDVVLTFSGLATSPAGDVPTVTDKNGNPVDLGTSTTITFVNGVATVGGSLVPYAAETATLHVTDGTYSTSTTGGSGFALTVTEGAATAYRIVAANSTPLAGASDVLTISKVDQYGNPITSVNGDVVLTFSGLATSPAGNTPTITDKNGTPVDQGSATTVTFTSGVATVGGTLVPYAAETATLDVTDGTLTSGGAGGTGALLTVGAGAFDSYRITAASSTPTAGATDALTIRMADAYGNTVTTFTGDAALTFSGLGTSDNGTVPTITDKTGTPVDQGTLTTITFTSGVSSAGGNLVAYKAETATLHVSDGSQSSTDPGGLGAALTVSGTGVASAYRITAATSTPNAGSADALTIRRVDLYGNTVTGFNGDVVLTFSGLGTSGTGNIPTVTDKNAAVQNQGTATTITFTSGVSTAGGSLIAYKAETATLHASDGTLSTSTAGGGGATLTISELSISQLGFATQPGKAEVGALFLQQPVVQTQDIYGNPSTSGLGISLSVNLSITAGSGLTGTLGTTLTLDIGTGAGNGVATFTDLKIDGSNIAGPGNVLTATASGLSDAVSDPFDLWTIFMTTDDVIVADRGPYFSTGTILISRGTAPDSAVIITSIKDPYEVSREANGNFVVVDYEASKGGGLFRIDRLTFAVTPVSSGDKFVVPFGVKVETKAPNAGQILVADLDAFSLAGAIFRVDPVTGAQTTLTQGGNFYFLQGLAIAPVGTPNDGDIYVTSVGDGAGITSKLIKVDPSTGAQTIISSGGNFNYPVGMAIESDGNILVVDALAKMVIRVDPGTGVQTVLSDAANAAQGTGLNTFLLPTHVTLDSAGELYVSDGKVNAGVNERLLFKVDKTTGNRTLVTKDGFFEQPRGLQIIP